MKRGWVALIAGVCLLMAGSAGVAQAAKKPAKKVSATSALRTLDRQTTALPKTVVSRTQRRRLHDAARRARIAAKSKPCSSVAALTRYRTVLRTVKPRKGKRNARGNLRLAALGPASLKASRKLLSDRRAKGCGGGVIPTTLPEAKTTVLSSDANGMRCASSCPRCSSRRADRRRQELDPARAARHRQRPRRHRRARHPGRQPAPSACRTARRSRSCRARPSPTRSTASTCSRRSPSRSTQRRRPPGASRTSSSRRSPSRRSRSTARPTRPTRSSRPPRRRPDPRPGARRHDRRPADPGRAVRRRRPHAEGPQHRRRRGDVRGRRRRRSAPSSTRRGSARSARSLAACSTRSDRPQSKLAVRHPPLR